MRKAIYALLILLVGCGGLPFEAHNPERYDPPALYQEWFGEVQECTKLTGEINQLIWYSVDSLAYKGQEEDFVAGIWLSPNEIFIHHNLVLDEVTVKHEMIHYLLQSKGHPEEFRCQFSNP